MSRWSDRVCCGLDKTRSSSDADSGGCVSQHNSRGSWGCNLVCGPCSSWSGSVSLTGCWSGGSLSCGRSRSDRFRSRFCRSGLRSLMGGGVSSQNRTNSSHGIAHNFDAVCRILHTTCNLGDIHLRQMLIPFGFCGCLCIGWWSCRLSFCCRTGRRWCGRFHCNRGRGNGSCWCGFG